MALGRLFGGAPAAPAPPTRNAAEVAAQELEARRRAASARGREQTIYGGRSFLGGPANQPNSPGAAPGGPTAGRTLLGG